ncbi:MAG: hypothetical protein ACXAEF_15675, partial [Candidatus Thorarchaeota archaeon]
VVWPDSQNSTWVHELEHAMIPGTMSTDNRPEVGSFIAERSSPIFIGLYNLGMDEGEYHLIVDTRAWTNFSNPSNTIEIPIPDSDGSRAAWFRFSGLSLNGSIYNHTISNISILNVFPPVVNTVEVTGAGAVKTVVWTIYDRNSQDSHVYEVLLSSYDGSFYQLLRPNLTELTYDWDSTGFADGNYSMQVRVSDSFGFTANATSDQFEAGSPSGHWHSGISISGPDDLRVQQFTLGQSIRWSVSTTNLAEYSVKINGVIVKNGTISYTRRTVIVDIDTSISGVSEYVLTVRNPSNGLNTIHKVIVIVEQSLVTTGFTSGVTFGLLVVILWVVVLRIKTPKNNIS